MRTSLVKELFPEVKPEHKKPLTQKSGALCIVKNRSRWEPAVATHMASRKSVPINDAHLFSQVAMKAAQRAFY